VKEHSVSILNRWDFVLTLLTTLSVAGATFYSWLSLDTPAHHSLPVNVYSVLAVSLFFIMFICFLYHLEFKKITNRHYFFQASLYGAIISVSAILFLFSIGFPAILMIILVAKLAEVKSLTFCLLIAIGFPLLTAVYHEWWLDEQHVFISAFLYMLFNLFALMVSLKNISERKAKEYTAHLLRELKATQALLSITSKRDERLRISRDLHDALGHHLTALSLQLEVAYHTDSSQKNEHIETAQKITKLLLSDVREAVSDIRHNTDINIIQSLNALTEHVDGIQLTLYVEPNLTLTNVRLADAVLRCVQEGITNMLKHSKGTHGQIHLEKNNNQLALRIQDNGKSTQSIQPGNGLTGMQERIELLDGKLNIQKNETGCQLLIHLPLDHAHD
jgi:signal transduction histidine kinase